MEAKVHAVGVKLQESSQGYPGGAVHFATKAVFFPKETKVPGLQNFHRKGWLARWADMDVVALAWEHFFLLTGPLGL